MCIDPVTATLMVVGTGMKMFGAIREGNAKGTSLDAQASQNERLIELERTRQAMESDRLRDNAARMTGRQIAAFADNGIQIEGSAVDVIDDTANEFDKDLFAIQEGSRIKRQNLSFEADQFRRGAKSARKSGKLNAIGELISGGTKLASGFSGAPTSSTTAPTTYTPGFETGAFF